jgi:hypothetical protein
MLRRVDLLITQIRRQSENQEFTSTSGISDDEILEYVNNGLHRLQTVILTQHPNVFIKEKVIPCVAGQEEYSIPSDCYLGNKITLIEYSETGLDRDYRPLERGILRNRTSDIQGNPLFYIRRSEKFLLNPIPQTSQSKVRISYIKRINEVDKRRGVISTAITSGSSITSLIIDTGGNPPLDSTSLSEHEHLCVVDREGNITMANIPFDSIDSSTGIVTISSGFTFEDGESISVGDYIVGGLDTSSHSEYQRNCERYIIAYSTYKLMARDSSIDITEQNEELINMEREIAATYAEIEDDIVTIPILQSWDI